MTRFRKKAGNFVLALCPVFFSLFFSHCKDKTVPTVPASVPIIHVSASSLTFSGTAGGSNPPQQEIQIWNSMNSGVLNYSMTNNAAWLVISPSSGTSNGEKKAHTISVNSAGLPEGNHEATITISDPKAGNNPQKVSVTLALSKSVIPKISVSSNSLSFSGTAGGQDPSSQEIQVWNSGEGGTIDYTITKDKDWLAVAPSSGSSSGEKKTHTVSVHISGYGEGKYTGVLIISDANASNSPQQVNIILDLAKAATPKICVIPSNLTFSGIVGGQNPPFQEIEIWNCGDGGTLNYSLTSNAAWLAVIPSSGSSSGQKNKHRVELNIAGLSEGTYTTVISVSDPKASNSPQNAVVNLVLTKSVPVH